MAWRIEDVLPTGSRLDFTRPFLPWEMLRVDLLPQLTDAERLTVNHVFSHAYLSLFVFVEEYIAADAIRLAQAEQGGDPTARALLRFTEEEVKHQVLFRRFADVFRAGFGPDTHVLDNAHEVATWILARQPLAILLTTCHLELITQAHYAAYVREREAGLESRYEALLRSHWIEECQHAKLDRLEIDKRLVGATAADVEAALDNEVVILSRFDRLLQRQAELDVATFAGAITRPLADDDSQRLAEALHQSYRSHFVLAGLRHVEVRGLLDRLRTHMTGDADATITLEDRIGLTAPPA